MPMTDGSDFALSNDLVRLASLLAPALGGRSTADYGFDEDIVTLAIRRHRIGPLLYAAALPRKDEIALAVFAALERSYRTNVQQHVYTELTLKQLSFLFKNAGIDWMVLKGLPQARRLYPDPAYRSSSDIDILVSPRAFRNAAMALETAGFLPKKPPLSPRSLYGRVLYYFVRDVSFSGRIPRREIELHQRPFFATGARVRAMRLTAERPFSSEDFPAPTPGPDYAFYVIAHGALSHWARLKWLADLVPLFAAITDQDKLRIIAIAESTRATNSVAASLLLLDALFPYAALGAFWPWLDGLRNAPGVCKRLEVYARTLNLPFFGKNTPIDDRRTSFEARWSFFEAPSTRGRLIFLGPLTSALRALATARVRWNLRRAD